ncbi:hypothetical protein [Acidomonas methanolica]|uniref:Uncharacterized protein n=1 Tax=Acidomonas methanolica NBRC 104435 TaxID=1231351 RepID=A0A023D6Z3_ACIMT|nr:hypothetical protein [Acidomonas methanolica]TCS23803.1 hypothetical protein EDC31_12721 [Acidomonas methanolica]GAJ29854.1 hypothetical protein Amme_083_029 [Acidomonas methanolica NBRC 104435]GBQ53176.1 hypothetical protein AA0498_1889 [Acidomonas methanolica]GEL00203.1 hypothetical protein AME01nite_27010 [Acidomonas methanolica NBRC 104435]
MTSLALHAFLSHPVQSLSELSMLAFVPVIGALLVATFAADRTA